VKILDKEDRVNAETLLANAGMVIVSVPIHLTENEISELPPLARDSILVDQSYETRYQKHPNLAATSSPGMGLHQMDGPGLSSR
ncbi:bifunctional chorismate mutase/prephenate dehydrogenase, partial [Erwinia amylovora]|nr:bifunctional chorismate mutase/prephenate dehydrogenase [Erwinia amylovora]